MNIIEYNIRKTLRTRDIKKKAKIILSHFGNYNEIKFNFNQEGVKTEIIDVNGVANVIIEKGEFDKIVKEKYSYEYFIDVLLSDAFFNNLEKLIDSNFYIDDYEMDLHVESCMYEKIIKFDIGRPEYHLLAEMMLNHLVEYVAKRLDDIKLNVHDYHAIVTMYENLEIKSGFDRFSDCILFLTHIITSHERFCNPKETDNKRLLKL